MRRSLLLALALLLAAPAHALVILSGDGQGNTSPPPDDPGFDRVVHVYSLNGIYLGNGWVVTANHVAAGTVVLSGVSYDPVPGSEVQLHNPDNSLADLKVFRIASAPSLPLMKIRATTPVNGTNTTLIADGSLRGASTSWMGHSGFSWASPDGLMHWGTNTVASSAFVGGNWTIATNFTSAPGATSDEAQGANGDSGGALFIKNGSTWELAGVLFAIGPWVNQPEPTALYGNLTYATNLSIYRSQLISLTRPQCSNEIDDDGDGRIDWPADPQCSSELDNSEFPDQDGDGVADSQDNCLLVANPDQIDTDHDGYGNLCDSDFDGDGMVGALDFSLLKASFGKSVGSPGYDPNVDLDSDGIVGVLDYSLFRFMFGQPPGPSGLSCAGTPPCP